MTHDIDRRVGVDITIEYSETRAIKSVICRKCSDSLVSCSLRKMNPSYYCGHSFKVGEKIDCIKLFDKCLHLCNKHFYQEMKDYLKTATLMGWDIVRR